MVEDFFDIEQWRKDNPMDYILAIKLISSASNKNEVFKTIFKIARLHIPNVLYKFVSLTEDSDLNQLKLDTLQNQTIYMSDIKDLNDPFDSIAYFYNSDELKKYPRLEACEGRIIDDFAAFNRVSSLTKNDENTLPMWAHYANNHKGFCVSYEMSSKDNMKFSSCTFPMQYVDQRIDVTALIDQQIEKIIKEIEIQTAEGKKEILFEDLTLVFMIALLCNLKKKIMGLRKRI